MRARLGFRGEDDGMFGGAPLDGCKLGEGWTKQQLEAFFGAWLVTATRWTLWCWNGGVGPVGRMSDDFPGTHVS